MTLETALMNAVKPNYDEEKGEWVLYCGQESHAQEILTAARRWDALEKALDPETLEQMQHAIDGGRTIAATAGLDHELTYGHKAMTAIISAMDIE